MTNYVKGAGCIILSSFSFALMAVFVRLSGDVNFIQKTFFRNCIAFVAALAVILRGVRRDGLRSVRVPKESVKFLILRAAAGTVGIFGNFYAIDRLSLSDASILNKMAPFFAVIFSFFISGEKISPVPAATIAAAFCGAALVVKPSFDFSAMAPALAGLSGGLGAGVAYACVRKLGSQKCSSAAVVLFFSAFSMLCAVPKLVLDFEPMTARQTLCLFAAGAAAAAGQFSVTAAYYSAPASDISIFDYFQVIFAALFGFFLFGQVPDALSVCGYLVIILAAALAFLHSRRRVRPE